MTIPEKPPIEEVLEHHGVKGMKWGVRKDYKNAVRNLSGVSEELNRRQDEKRFASSLNEQAYKKLTTQDRTINAGSVLKRTTRDASGMLGSDPLYVSTNEKDAEVYRALIPTWAEEKVVSKKYKDHYEMTIQATKNLKSPSEKTRVDAYTTLMSTKSVDLGDGTKITGREYLVRAGLGDSVKSLSNKQIALTYYGQLVSQQGIRNEPLSSAYFKTLSKKGYNAIVDDNDKGVFSKEPLLIFNPNGSLKTIQVRKLTNEEILKSQATLKLPDEERR